MDFPLNDVKCIKFCLIVNYLNRADKIIIMKINRCYRNYFQKYNILLKIYDYFWLIKRQRRRPVMPNLYSRLCGIDLFVSSRVPHPIMSEYRQNRVYIKNISKFQYPLKYEYSLNNSIYMFDTLLLIDTDIKKIFKIINIFSTPKTFKKISYHNQLFNYQSLGVSINKARMLSSFNHDFYFHNKKFKNPSKLLNLEWKQYIDWKKGNKKYAI